MGYGGSMLTPRSRGSRNVLSGHLTLRLFVLARACRRSWSVRIPFPPGLWKTP